MPIEVELPDGSIAEFPDGMADDEINAVLQRQFGGGDLPITDLPTVQAAPPDFSGVTATVDSTASGRQADGWKAGPLRDALFGARSVLQGAGGLIGAFGGDALGALETKITGRPVASFRDNAARLADVLGLPQAQTSGDRVLGDIGEALTGTGLTLGAGGVINAGRPAASLAAGQGALINPTRAAAGGVLDEVAGNAPTVAQRGADLLTAQPLLQALSATTGAGASGIARENGAGAGGQILAGVLGGLTPAAITAGAPAALRGTVRGGESNRQALAQAIEDFDVLGATPSVGQGTGTWSRQGAESLLGSGPTSAGVMARFADRQADAIGTGLQTQADGLFRNPSAERAGRAIEQGIRGENGFIQTSRDRANQLYSRLDELIPQDSRVDVANVRQVLSDLDAGIPGAPNTSNLFRNSRITGIQQALEKDLAIPTDAQRTLDDALGQLDRLYASRDAATQDAGRFSAFANDQANLTDRFYPVSGQPRIPGRHSPSVPRAQEGAEAAAEAVDVSRGRASQARELEATIDQLQSAAQASGGKLPYQAVQKLRTLVGNELESTSLVADVPRSKWKAVYGALSRDMEEAASTPEAKQALDRANRYFNARSKRIDEIDRVIDRNGGPEKIYQAVMAGTRDGGSTLRAVMQSLPEDGQKAVTAAALRRMGMANPGAQDAAGEAFSAATFLTNWNRTSPEARRAMFDRFGPGFSRDLDKIATVAERIKEGGQALANPSGTARQGAQFAYWGSLGGSIMTGNLTPALWLGVGGVGSNLAARLMTNPGWVKWLSKATDLPVAALPAQVNVLKRIAANSGDADIAEAAALLQDAGQNPPAESED